MARVQSSIHQITGSAAVKLLGFAGILLMLSPVVAVLFDPASNAGGAGAGATMQARGTFVLRVWR